MSKINGTTEGLRDYLFGELEALKEGKITINHAIAASKLATQILNAARLDLEHYRLVKAIGETKGYPISSVKLIQR